MHVAKSTHDGRVAIVTGAARGIGQAIALKLSDLGAKLVLFDLDEADDTARMLAGESLILTGDVSSADDWERIDQMTQRRFGRTDIVVNNAGMGTQTPIDQLDFATWKKTLAVNLDSHFLSAKQFVPQMRKSNWGRFVNISSNSIGFVVPGMSHYMASKMGVIGFVRGLANDVADSGITVNAVLPSLTNTRLFQGMPEDVKRATWQGQAIKRFAEPADIAGAVGFLTSDDASFITGQALPVDGGQYKVS